MRFWTGLAKSRDRNSNTFLYLSQCPRNLPGIRHQLLKNMATMLGSAEEDVGVSQDCQEK